MSRCRPASRNRSTEDDACVDRYKEPDRLAVAFDDQRLPGAHYRGRSILELPDTNVTHVIHLQVCGDERSHNNPVRRVSVVDLA